MKKHYTSIRKDQPGVYQIKLVGRLGQEWSTSFDNLDLQVESTENGSPITTLSGTVTDQAALHGLLRQVCDLGLVLLSVEWLSEPD
jgi:hypothetical protein